MSWTLDLESEKPLGACDLSDLRAYRFRIRLRSTLKLRNDTYKYREGVLIERNGRWAEASPLPGFSSESILDVIAALHGDHPITPSLNFAIDSLDLPEMDVIQVPYNQLLLGDPDQILGQLGRGESAGCQAFKVKVGRGKVGDEIDLVRKLRSKLPADARLRLDANRAWSYDDAIMFANGTSDLALEYIEEPLQDPSRLEELRAACRVPYALDETLLEPVDLGVYPNASALICKPSLLGGRDAIERLAEAGKPLVFSGAFESGVGITRIMQLALAFSPTIPAGLDTLDWLVDDLLVESPVKVNGHIRVDCEPSVDPSSLERLI